MDFGGFVCLFGLVWGFLFYFVHLFVFVGRFFCFLGCLSITLSTGNGKLGKSYLNREDLIRNLNSPVQLLKDGSL